MRIFFPKKKGYWMTTKRSVAALDYYAMFTSVKDREDEG